MLEPIGKEAKILQNVDANHTRHKTTFRSVTKILLLVNSTPLIWYTKHQKAVETLTYGSELIAARIDVEMIIEVRYKLRMLGVPIKKPSVLIGTIMTVVVSITSLLSISKKKHNAIAYHNVREAIAAEICNFTHIDIKLSIADILNNSLRTEDSMNCLKDTFQEANESGVTKAVYNCLFKEN